MAAASALRLLRLPVGDRLGDTSLLLGGGHVLFGLRDRVGDALLAERIEQTGVVADLLDLERHHPHAELLVLGVGGLRQLLLERRPVLVELLRCHVGDDAADLTDQDLTNGRMNLLRLIVQEVGGGRYGCLFVDAVSDDRDTVDRYLDVVAGEDVGQLHGNRHRLQRHPVDLVQQWDADLPATAYVGHVAHGFAAS